MCVCVLFFFFCQRIECGFCDVHVWLILQIHRSTKVYSRELQRRWLTNLRQRSRTSKSAAAFLGRRSQLPEPAWTSPVPWRPKMTFYSGGSNLRCKYAQESNWTKRTSSYYWVKGEQNTDIYLSEFSPLNWGQFGCKLKSHCYFFGKIVVASLLQSQNHDRHGNYNAQITGLNKQHATEAEPNTKGNAYSRTSFSSFKVLCSLRLFRRPYSCHSGTETYTNTPSKNKMEQRTNTQRQYNSKVFSCNNLSFGANWSRPFSHYIRFHVRYGLNCKQTGVLFRWNRNQKNSKTGTTIASWISLKAGWSFHVPWLADR